MLAAATIGVMLLSSIARAQEGFSFCAISCTLAAANFAGCDATDPYCFCTSERALQSAQTCQRITCSAAERVLADKAIKALCAIATSDAPLEASTPSIASQPEISLPALPSLPFDGPVTMTVTETITETETETATVTAPISSRTARRGRMSVTSSHTSTNDRARPTTTHSNDFQLQTTTRSREGSLRFSARPTHSSSTLTVIPLTVTSIKSVPASEETPASVPIISAGRRTASITPSWSLILPLILAGVFGYLI